MLEWVISTWSWRASSKMKARIKSIRVRDPQKHFKQRIDEVVMVAMHGTCKK